MSQACPQALRPEAEEAVGGHQAVGVALRAVEERGVDLAALDEQPNVGALASGEVHLQQQSEVQRKQLTSASRDKFDYMVRLSRIWEHSRALRGTCNKG